MKFFFQISLVRNEAQMMNKCYMMNECYIIRQISEPLIEHA